MPPSETRSPPAASTSGDPQGTPRRLPRRTVQVIPHITDEIKRSIDGRTATPTWRWSRSAAPSATSSRCRSSRRSARSGIERGASNALFMHLTLVPFIATAGELKTNRPSTRWKELRDRHPARRAALPLQQPLPDGERRKIALFTNVRRGGDFRVDLDNIHKIPRWLHQPAARQMVVDQLPGRQGRARRPVGMDAVVDAAEHPIDEVTIAGRQVRRPRDAYKSVGEALQARRHPPAHAINLEVDGDHIEREGRRRALPAWTASPGPAASATAASKGKVLTAQFAREQRSRTSASATACRPRWSTWRATSPGLEGARQFRENKTRRIR